MMRKHLFRIVFLSSLFLLIPIISLHSSESEGKQYQINGKEWGIYSVSFSNLIKLTWYRVTQQ